MPPLNIPSFSGSPPVPGSEFWNPEFLGLSSRQAEWLPKLQAWLWQQQTPLAEALEGRPVSGPLPQKMADLEQSLLQNPEWREPAQAVEMLRLLAQVLEVARARGQTMLPAPRLPQVDHLPTSPFAGENLCLCLERVEAWRDLLQAWIERSPAVDHTSEELGDAVGWLPCVLLSAILHGGLLDSALLVALLRSWAAPEKAEALTPMLRPVAGRLPITLSLPWRGQAGAEQRTWYPDPLTATLLLRLPRQEVHSFWPRKAGDDSTTALSDRELRRWLWQKLRAAFRAADKKKLIHPLHQPGSLAQLLSTVAVVASLELPIVLVSYAQRRVRSHSLKPAAAARIWGPGSAPVSMPPREQRSSRAAEWRFDPSPDGEEIEPDWLLRLRQALRSEQRKPIRESLHWLQQRREGPPVGQRLTEFAYQLLTGGSSAGHPLAPSTIRRCVLTVSRRFGCLLGGEDPAQFPHDTLEALYHQVLEEADPNDEHGGLRRNVARSLYEFHAFLVRQYACRPLRRETLGLGRGLLTVDANLLMLEEYQEALAYLVKQYRLTPEQRRVARLLLMLGFRGGLRRMEAFGLQVQDLCEEDPAELLIRPWKMRRLKTHNATRKLPLFALLSEAELEELRSWKQERARWAAAENRFLWTLPDAPHTTVSPDLILEHIHEAIRTVTGDPDLHYHHLRHSCATWTSLRLLLTELPAPPSPLFPHWPETSQWLQEGDAFATRLYGETGPTRKHLWAVASLQGHSTPAITIEHYIHLLDLALAEALASSPLLQPDPSLVQKASGVPATTVQRWRRQENSLTAVPLRQYQRLYPDEPEHPVPPSALLSAEPSRTVPASWTESLWHFLHHCATTPGLRDRTDETDWYDLAEPYGLTPSAIPGILARAHKILRQKARTKERHHVIAVSGLPGADQTEGRSCCPVPPHSQADQSVARRFAPLVAELYRKDPAGTEAVLTYYVQNVVEEHNGLRFRRVEEARRYLAFLKKLKIPQQAIRLSSGDPARWREALAQSRRLKIEARPSQRASELTIEPVFDFPRGQGGAGFRYVLVMAALAGEELEQVPLHEETRKQARQKRNRGQTVLAPHEQGARENKESTPFET